MTNSPAVKAMIEYGMEEVTLGSGLTVYTKKDRSPTQMWSPTEGGFHRYEVPTTTLVAVGVDNPANGAAWGRPAEGNSGLVQVPWKPLEKWENVSGLHPTTHPECFEWVWPESEVEFIYQYAHTSEYGKEYVKISDPETGEVLGIEEVK